MTNWKALIQFKLLQHLAYTEVKKKYCNISSHFEWKSFITNYKSKTQFAHIISTRKNLFTLVLTVWMRATITYKKGWETKQPSARNGIVISRTSWSLWKVEITFIEKSHFYIVFENSYDKNSNIWKIIRTVQDYFKK